MAQILLPKIMEIGGGSSALLADVMIQMDLSRPYIVTDDFVGSLGLLGPSLDSLTQKGITADIFTGVIPDPTTESLKPALEVLQSGVYDCIVAIGGGSPIDSAKALAVLLEYGAEKGVSIMREIKAPMVVVKKAMPVIAIPTTAGTGSEMTKVTVISDSETGEKMLLMGPAFCPDAALIDYELTLKKPRRLTADTAIDSLTHAIEAYVSKKANPFSDGVALRAMRIIYENIHIVCNEPDNLQAREAMMLGATLGGMAFSNASVALVHGMSRPIGAHFHVPHGLSNAMLLPEITRFSLNNALPRYANCAREMGLADERDADQLAGAKLIEGLVKLNDDLEVPTPKIYGVKRRTYFDLIPRMAEEAMASGSPANNPKVPSIKELHQLYESVYE